MHWIIQKFATESGFDDLVDVLTRLELPMTLVKVIPFSHELTPKPDVENPIVVMGSTTLVKIAKSYGWGPGVWFNDNFTFERWKAGWGDELLNADAVVCRFEDVNFTGTKFIRPVDDLKLFAGGVVHADKFNEWKENVLRYDDGMVNSNTLVVVSSPREIYAEFRCFVINGHVVTASQYKRGDRVISSEIVDDRIIEYAQKMVDRWQPDVGFVIDIADTRDGLKVIEINNLNSSGFYKINLAKLVTAIEQLHD